MHAMSTKEADQVLKDILIDNRTQFGHDFGEHKSESGNDRLTKYYYVKDEGVTRSHDKTKKQIHEQQAEAKDKEVQQLLDKQKMNLQVTKAENPLFNTFKEKLAVLEIAKTCLDKLTGQVQDTICQLKVSTDPACQAKVKEVEDVLGRMTTHLQDIRISIFKNKEVDASSDHLQEKIGKMQGLQDLAMAHQDGWKLLKKRCLALLGH